MNRDERASVWIRRWKHLFQRGRVLDMTCRGGRNTALLMLDGRRVLACSEDVSALERLVGNPLLTLECRDLESEEWPWSEKTFVGVLITEPIGIDLLTKAWSVLAAEGVLLVDVPTSVDCSLKDRPVDERFPQEGALLRWLPPEARLVAYEEGCDDAGDVRVRLAAVKPGNPTPYAYFLDRDFC